MEPFALFNLLKSLLLDGASAPFQEGANPCSSDAPEPFNQPYEQGEFDSLKGENAQENANGAASNSAAPQQNYCLDFIRRHDERAGRRK